MLLICVIKGSLRLILWTQSPEPESEVGVRSPAIVMNIGLTV